MSEQPPPSSPPPKPQPAKKPRNWGKRFRWAIIVLLGGVVVFRISLMFLLPWVINHVAGLYGLKADYDRIDLSLLGGDAGIWHLQLVPREGGDALVRAEYTRCNISPLNLLRGRLMIYRLEAEAVDINVERKADGTIPLLQRFESTAPASASAPASSSSPASNTPIDLTSPFRVEAFRLTDVHAHILDEAVTPNVDADVEVNVLLTDLDSTVRPTHLVADISAAPILDLLHIDATGKTGGQNLTANLTIQMRGLHPRPAAGYLAELGIKPTGNYIAAQATAVLQMAPAPNHPGAVAGNLTINNASVTADGTEVGSLDQLAIDAQAIDTTTALLTDVKIDGVRCIAQRTTAGTWAGAGLEWMGGIGGTEGSSPAPAPVPMAPLHWGIGRFSLADLQATVHDATVTPATNLIFKLQTLTAANLSSDHAAAAPIDLQCSAPGIVNSIHLGGSITPCGGARQAALTLAMTGIQPTVLAPYLRAAGLQSTFDQGTFGCQFNLSQNSKTGKYDAHLTDVSLQNGQQLFALKSIDALGVASVGGGWSADNVQVHGPTLLVARDAAGALELLGFRTIAGDPAPAPVISSPSPAGASSFAPIALPRLHIGHFLWTDIQPRFEDRCVRPATSLSFSDAGLEMTDLNLDPSGTADKPATIHAWLKAPHLIDDLEAQGQFDPARRTMDLTIDGTGITASGIKRYFTGDSIQPVLQNGSLHVEVTANQGALAVRNFSFADGSKQLAALREMSIEGLKYVGAKWSVHAIDVESPSLQVDRQPDGSIELAGVRVIPTTSTENAQFAALYAPSARAPAVTSSPGINASLGSLNISNADVRWTDATLIPAASLHLTIDALLHNLAIDQTATLNDFTLREERSGTIKVTGTFNLSPIHPAADLDIAASQIRQGSLGGYLPPGVSLGTRDGQLRLSIDAAADLAAGNGHISVSNFDFRDGASAPAILSFDSFHAAASKFQPAAKIIAIDDITLTGLEGSASRDADGNLHLLGFELGNAAPVAVKVAPRAGKVVVAPPQHPRLVQAVSIRRLAAIAAMKYPLVTLQSLNLNVRRFSISDASRPASKPLVLSNLRLRNTKPIQLLGNDPPSRPPVQLELTGAVQPLADSITADINASPFADEPGFGVYLTVTGIHGQGITDLVPELRDRIDGSPLTDGRLQSHFGAAIFLPPHNDPLQFDLSHGFKMDAGIKGTRFTLGPNGPVLAGIGEISLDEIRVEPHRGVEIKDVEVDDISANVYRDQRGIYALGMLLKSSPPPAAQSSAAHAINPPRVATPPPTPPSTPIRLDDVLVSGLNFNYVDKTCNPPLVVPLNQLDLEIHSFSNMMRFEDRPCRFSLLVGAASKPNQSPLFSQIESSGNFSLYPHPSGWVKSSISGVDLSQLRGPAAQAGITLAGGTFDGSADAYLNGKIINTHCALSVTDLSVAEPPNGPIQRELKLNVPLNVAIGVLEDPSKAISIGIDLALSTDQMTFAAIESQVDSQVPSAVAQVIGTAIASAPAKVALAFLPIGGSSPDNRPIVIHFSPGDTSLSAADLQRLEPLIRRMRSDDSLVVTLTHSLSPADLARAQTLANPSYQDSLNLAYRLHTQEMSLLTQRAQAAQRASAELASGFGPDADPALQQVRQIDQTLETTEDALDEVYDLLRPGAERWAARRTRRAALEIGRDRLKAIQDAILAGSTRKANLDPRVKVFSPSFNAARGAADGSVTITLNYKKT